MKKSLLSLLMSLILAFTFGSCSDTDASRNNVTQVTGQVLMTYSPSDDEKELARIINVYRASKGLRELESVNHISYKAQEHNLYMIQKNVASHDNFDARANNIMQVLGAVKVAENIAFNFSTPNATLNAWIDSPTHKENLEGDFTHFGLAITASPAGKNYYTAIFMKK